MFLLLGEKEQAKPPVEGEFFCSVCEQKTPFSHHVVQRFFTLFGLSLAKLDTSSDYVRCNQCDSCYDPRILSQPQSYQTAIDKVAMLRALCYLLSGYGSTAQSRERVAQIYQHFTQLNVEQQILLNEVKIVEGGLAPTLPYLSNLRPLLSQQAKHNIVVACYQFANGSCMMEHQDRVRINTIASSLEISLPEVEYLINHSA